MDILKGWMFGRQPVDDVGYVRSVHLAAFSFFKMNKEDSSLMMTAFEKTVDADFTQTVDIAAFGSDYCDDVGDIFEMVWHKYQILLEPELAKLQPVKSSKKTQKAPKALNSPQSTKQIHSTVEHHSINLVPGRPTYFHMICFLMFLLSVPENEICFLIYWLWFHEDHRVTSEESLFVVMDEIWGLKRKREIVDVKKKLKKSFQFVDFAEFNAEKFRIYDIQSGGGWSKLLVQATRRIKKKLLGDRFWKRMSLHFQESFVHLHDSYARLTDDNTHKLIGVKSYRNRGERKFGRKLLRQYVRLVLRYLKMPRGELDIVLSESGNPFAAVYALGKLAIRAGRRSIVGRSAKVLPLEMVTGLRRRFGNRSGVVVEGAGEVEEVEEAVFLEHKYKHSLVTPVDDLFNDAQSMVQAARDLIDTCSVECVPESELRFSIFATTATGAGVQEGGPLEQTQEEQGEEMRGKLSSKKRNAESGAADAGGEGSDGRGDVTGPGTPDYLQIEDVGADEGGSVPITDD